MKYIKYFSFLFAGMLLLTSCEDHFSDVNVDPDNPIEVTPEVILTQVQLRLAYVLAGDMSRYTGLYTHHVDGVGRQFVVYNNYGVLGTDVDNLWSNLYTHILMDNRQMMNDATEKGYNQYLGVGKAIEAYSLMLLTDHFGDIPYSESFQGIDLLQPKFDSQASIYEAIFTLLGEAKSALAKDNAGYPFGGDLIYGGDTEAWVKFCNVLEARGRLHLTKRDPSNYQKALDAINAGGFESSDDDALLSFGSTPAENSPWYQYIEQRDDCEVGVEYKNIMVALNDPRNATFGFDHTVPGHPIFTKEQAVNLLSFTEQNFIAAEAMLSTGGAGVHVNYTAGIASSFIEAGMSDDSLNIYMAQTMVDPGDGNVTLEQVMTQKYIALYTQPEVFTDWRRTGFPTLPVKTGPEIPRRFPYAQTEVFSNLNTPSQATVNQFSRIWWDE